MIYLQSNRLRVEICEPNEAPNTTLRFDRAGFISEVTLDGKIRFCATEPNNLWHPSSGGRGLCSEIICDVSEEFEVGEFFPKFGVGILRKSEEEPYCFYKKYETELFPCNFKAAPSEVTFETASIPCKGYALMQKKEIKLEDNRLTIRMHITNSGEKPLHIQEYCHNFLSIGGMAIGEAYTIDLPGINKLKQGDLQSTLGVNNYIATPTGIKIAGYSGKFATLQFAPEQIKNGRPFNWKMYNSAAKANVACEESFTPSGAALWSVDHMFSPEVFFDVSLCARESAFWQRTYTFDADC